MYIQTLKNAILFLSTLLFWLLLITIEVITGYSGVILQIFYGLSMFALFVLFWFVNRPVVRNIQNEFIRFISCGAIAMVLMGVYLTTAIFIGIYYKRLIASWM